MAAAVAAAARARAPAPPLAPAPATVISLPEAVISPPEVCEDDHHFLDAYGHSCAAWALFNCSEATSQWAFTPEEQMALLNACKETCHQCMPTVHIMLHFGNMNYRRLAGECTLEPLLEGAGGSAGVGVADGCAPLAVLLVLGVAAGALSGGLFSLLLSETSSVFGLAGLPFVLSALWALVPLGTALAQLLSTALGAVPTTLIWMALPLAFSTLLVVPIVPFACLQRSRSAPPAAML